MKRKKTTLVLALLVTAICANFGFAKSPTPAAPQTPQIGRPQVKPKLKLKLSCDADVSAGLSGPITGCGADATAALVNAGGGHVTGGGSVTCKGCPTGQTGCTAGFVGNNISIMFFEKGDGQYGVTITPLGGGPSSAGVSCTPCT